MPTVLPRSVPGGGAALLARCSRSNSLFSNKVLINVDFPSPDSPDEQSRFSIDNREDQHHTNPLTNHHCSELETSSVLISRLGHSH